MKSRIALVEDDEVILKNYADFLRGCGLDVETYSDKATALQDLTRDMPDMVLLDITLNGDREAGFGICSHLRHCSPQTPIVFLTSHDGEVDKISGLRLGADDYITKDVSFDYLIVRIEALLRRREAYRNEAMSARTQNAAATDDELRLDTHASTASWRSQRLDLSLTQYWMLAELYRQPGQAKSHQELMRAGRVVVEPNTVTAHVKAIRDAFRRIDPSFDQIVTERGRGYRWLPR